MVTTGRTRRSPFFISVIFRARARTLSTMRWCACSLLPFLCTSVFEDQWFHDIFVIFLVCTGEWHMFKAHASSPAAVGLVFYLGQWLKSVNIGCSTYFRFYNWRVLIPTSANISWGLSSYKIIRCPEKIASVTVGFLYFSSHKLVIISGFGSHIYFQYIRNLPIK